MSEGGGFAEWCIVELMGHKKTAGFVTEVEIAGARMLRIDVPTTAIGRPAMTQFVGAASIYCLTTVTEEVARAVVGGHYDAPVERWEWPKLAGPEFGKPVATNGEYRYPEDDSAAEFDYGVVKEPTDLE